MRINFSLARKCGAAGRVSHELLKSVLMRNVASVVLVASLLASCASQVPTKTPSGVMTTFEFDNADPEAYTSLVTFQDDYDCYGRVLRKFYGQWDKYQLDEEQRPYQTVNFVFSGVGRSGGKLASINCSGLITFRADESKLYRISITHSDGMCGATVARSDASSSDGWVKVPVVPRTFTKSFWDANGPFCTPDAALKGSSLLVTPRGY